MHWGKTQVRIKKKKQENSAIKRDREYSNLKQTKKDSSNIDCIDKCWLISVVGRL